MAGYTWRVERKEDSVSFWVGNQGFTVASRCGDGPEGVEHLPAVESMLTLALSRIAPDNHGEGK